MITVVRRIYIWGWFYAILVLIAWLVKHSITLWRFLIFHFTFLSSLDPIFMAYWPTITFWLYRAVVTFSYGLVIWYVWDWLRGYALLDFFSYRLRAFLLRSTVKVTDQTVDVAVQNKANRAIKSVKLRYQWFSPHMVIATIHLPSNQIIAKVVRERVIGGLGDDEINTISWLNRCKVWPLSRRHWELDQSSLHYLKFIGRKG